MFGIGIVKGLLGSRKAAPPPPPEKPVGMYIAIATGILILVGIGFYFITKKK